MDETILKIWKAVKSLEKADIDSTAMCYSIIDLMIDQGLVTREEFARQVEKSVAKVVSVHKQIAEAMRERYPDSVDDEKYNILH